MPNYETVPRDVVEALCVPGSYQTAVHFGRHNTPMPSLEALAEIMELLRAIVFPGYFMESDITPDNITYYTGAKLDKVLFLLTEQLKRGYCFFCETSLEQMCPTCASKPQENAYELIRALPDIRRLLALDALAAYEGDPAATRYGETVFCYPSIRVMINHRIAHQLYKTGVPLIPRMISEMAHSATGIDIHPGAQIGEKFFIDHGTGVVIGETCVIGNNVKLYQNVTLGAKSFPLDEHGNPIKGIPRHPILQDNVIVYAGATILGRVTIGAGSTVGGNVWLTKSVPPNSKITRPITEV
ncbi:serine O-acetyltransferase [Candidatus Moduliflexus flocculans]|uniref:serine O-acetyltransferase n=1 Tax=Candidatus Moduliflexus flocculans TaxID=1499966 RepID=A0A0S6VW04_9BACT|nr:serine O-acetyltransferase [Candidatus Moduliflexus flocculans]